MRNYNLKIFILTHHPFYNLAHFWNFTWNMTSMLVLIHDVRGTVQEGFHSKQQGYTILILRIYEDYTIPKCRPKKLKTNMVIPLSNISSKQGWPLIWRRVNVSTKLFETSMFLQIQFTKHPFIFSLTIKWFHDILLMLNWSEFFKHQWNNKTRLSLFMD